MPASKVVNLRLGVILNSTAKTILFWVLILATAVLLYSVVQRTSTRNAQAIQFSRFLTEIEHDGVKDVTIADSDITGHLASGESFKTVLPMDYPELINL